MILEDLVDAIVNKYSNLDHLIATALVRQWARDANVELVSKFKVPEVQGDDEVSVREQQSSVTISEVDTDAVE